MNETFVSIDNVTYPMASIPSMIRYCMIFPHLKYRMLFYDILILGSTILFMSLAPIVVGPYNGYKFTLDYTVFFLLFMHLCPDIVRY